MSLGETCIVCGGEYQWPSSCRCDPRKSDEAMAKDDPLAVNPIERGKTVSDRMQDGFLMLNLLETEDDQSND